MADFEQEIRQAIDPTPQLQPEPLSEPKPKITIYDFSRLLAENEPAEVITNEPEPNRKARF